MNSKSKRHHLKTQFNQPRHHLTSNIKKDQISFDQPFISENDQCKNQGRTVYNQFHIGQRSSSYENKFTVQGRIPKIEREIVIKSKVYNTGTYHLQNDREMPAFKKMLRPSASQNFLCMPESEQSGSKKDIEKIDDKK